MTPYFEAADNASEKWMRSDAALADEPGKWGQAGSRAAGLYPIDGHIYGSTSGERRLPWRIEWLLVELLHRYQSRIRYLVWVLYAKAKQPLNYTESAAGPVGLYQA